MTLLRFLLFFILGFMAAAQAAIYNMPKPGNDVVGQTFTIRIKKGDTINHLRQKYDISYHEILEANPGTRPRRLRVGQTLLIPAQFILPKYRKGIVINIPELRLFYFTPDGKYIFTTTVGLGRAGWRTPTTKTYVIKKQENPTWHVPKSIAEYTLKTRGKELPKEIPPGPDNPLGEYAIYLAHHGYLIHGTNDSRTVGLFFSSGCIRLNEKAIKTLFSLVKIYSPVYIIHHNNKVGWLNGILYLEAHKPVSLEEELSKLNNTEIQQEIETATNGRLASIDLQKLNATEKRQTGVPTPIGEAITE